MDFFSVQLGGSENIYPAQIEDQLNADVAAIQQSQASHPYSFAFGPNSNSVAYSELQSIGIAVPITNVNLPILGDVGELEYQVNGQTQLFTGWGQNILQ